MKKAIFIGTEQDLIEAGFKIDKKFIFPKFVTKTINNEEELQVCIEENSTVEIWVFNNKKHCGTCNFDYIDKSIIQDLIDKSLVRWE